MGTSYMKNHMGLALDDTQFEDIPYPTAELVTHVTLKTVQAGAVMGTLLGPLGAMARASTRNLAGIYQTAGRYGRRGVVIGLPLGPLFTYLRVRNLTEPEIVDRDYRLRHNRGQVRVDRASIVGAVVGAGTGIATNRCPMTGGVFGIATGVLGMAVYNNAFQDKK